MKAVKIPEATAYMPMVMAFSLMASGAAAAMGNSERSAPIPPSATSATQTERMRELSTQLPTCRTGGMPTASQTSRRPGPACSSAASGRSSPALAEAMALHPVCTTSTSCAKQAADQGQVVAVLGKAWSVAADDAHDAADAARRDRVDERPIA